MTPADAYRRCLFARTNTPLWLAVEAIRAYLAADKLANPDKGRMFWREELLLIVTRLHDPEDLLAACLVAVEQGIADAGTVYDRSPVPGFR